MAVMGSSSASLAKRAPTTTETIMPGRRRHWPSSSGLTNVSWVRKVRRRRVRLRSDLGDRAFQHATLEGVRCDHQLLTEANALGG
jgi:hypothetical protein